MEESYRSRRTGSRQLVAARRGWQICHQGPADLSPRAKGDRDGKWGREGCQICFSDAPTLTRRVMGKVRHLRSPPVKTSFQVPSPQILPATLGKENKEKPGMRCFTFHVNGKNSHGSSEKATLLMPKWMQRALLQGSPLASCKERTLPCMHTLSFHGKHQSYLYITVNHMYKYLLTIWNIAFIAHCHMNTYGQQRTSRT